MIVENYTYQISKRLHAFWQNYKLGKQLKTIAKLFLFVIIAWIVGSILTIISEILFDNPPAGAKPLLYYLRYFWVVIIELVSGFDVPESIQLHVLSRIISILMLLMNLTLVAFFTAHIVSLLNTVIKRFEFLPEKPLKFTFKRPILICGINDKVKDIIREIRKKCYNREIIVVDELADKIPKFEKSELSVEDVWYVKGNPMDRDVLHHAIGSEDNRVIILSEKNSQGILTDLNAITTALAIEEFYSFDSSREFTKKIDLSSIEEEKFIYTVLEICKPMNKYHFKKTKINEWICVRDYAMRLLSQAILNPGIVSVYMNLLGKGGDDGYQNFIEFSSTSIPDKLLNRSYFDIKTTLLKDKSGYGIEDAIIIGFSKKLNKEEQNELGLELRNTPYFIQMNPTLKPSKKDGKEINIMKYVYEKFDVSTDGKGDKRSIRYRFADDLDYYQVSEQTDRNKYVYKTVFSRDTVLRKHDKLICIVKNINYSVKTHTKNKYKELVYMNDNNTSKDEQKVINEVEKKKILQEIKMPGSLEKHVIICNWNKKANLIIEELRDESIKVQHQKPIVIITEDASKIEDFHFNQYSNIYPVIGVPADEKTLKRANIYQADTVVVLASESDPDRADSQSIIVALAVDKLNPDAHLIIELLKAENEKFVRYSAVDEIICLELLSEKLLAQSALTPGLSRVYMDLLTQSAATNEIYLCDIPDKLQGKSYEYAEQKIISLEKDLILIGFSTRVEKKRANGSTVLSGYGNVVHERRIIINPSKLYDLGRENYSTEHILNKDDKLFLIAFDRPNLETLIK